MKALAVIVAIVLISGCSLLPTWQRRVPPRPDNPHYDTIHPDSVGYIRPIWPETYRA